MIKATPRRKVVLIKTLVRTDLGLRDVVCILRQRVAYLRSGMAWGRPLEVNEEIAKEFETLADVLVRRHHLTPLEDE